MSRVSSGNLEINQTERGKRKLARQMLVVQLGVSVLGIWMPQAWVIAQFYAPFLIPAAITLFIGDAISDSYIKSTSIRTTPK